ncbi:MAG TPA: hypothetical protein VH682_01445 [Gemmataceae bacterium]
MDEFLWWLFVSLSLDELLAMLRRYLPAQTLLFLGLWLILMVAGRSRFFLDPGALWHPVVGQHILSRGELPYEDSFSCTFAGRPWIAQQWLGECVLALLHRIGGLDTILLATATLLAGLYTWLGHRLIREGMHPLIAGLVVALALLGCSYHLHPRPHLLTLVLMGWTFARLCDFETGRCSLRSLFWLVPLYALWANVHGGMVGGVATLAVAVAGWGAAKLAGRPTPLTGYRQLVLLGVLVLACGSTAFLNPYGWELPRVWFALMGSSLLPQIIQEHAPLFKDGSAAWTVVLFGLIYLAALLGVPPRRLRVTWLLPLLWFVLAWTRIRHGPLFVLTAALALGEMYPHVRWREWLVRRGSITCRLQTNDAAASTGRAWRPVVLPGLVVLAALVLEAATASVAVLGHGWAYLDPSTSPVELLPELRAYEQVSPPGTPIFNDMLFGGFLIERTPNLRVFVDDRCELYGDSWLEEYASAYRHHPERIEEWAREYGFDRALVIPDSVFDCYLRTASGWAVVRKTEGAVLYRRVTSCRETEVITFAVGGSK